MGCSLLNMGGKMSKFLTTDLSNSMSNMSTIHRFEVPNMRIVDEIHGRNHFIQ